MRVKWGYDPSSLHGRLMLGIWLSLAGFALTATVFIWIIHEYRKYHGG